MSLSALGKFVLPPVIASAAVFSAMSFPLAVLGDKPINIRFEEEPVYDGRIRDIAPPYVVAITALSLGTGVAIAALGGWRTASRRSSEIEQQLTSLEEHLLEKEKMLKELKLSESRLQVSGLSNFLDDEVPFDSSAHRKALPAVVTQPVVAQTPAQNYQPSVKPMPSVAPKPMINKPVEMKPMSTTNAASAFASAQTYRGYTQAEPVNQTVASNAGADQTTVTPQEFETLQQQLREMMERMQSMQDTMQGYPQTQSVKVNTPEKFRVYYEAPNTDEVQFH